LLDAAATLFRERGFAGATTRELASVVGIHSASMYHHVRSKEDLLYVLCTESLTKVAEDAEAAVASENEPLAQLHALIVAHLTTSLFDQDKHATMLTELRSLPTKRRNEVIALRDRYERIVMEVVAAGQADGSLRSDLSARLLTLALLNLLNWTIFWYSPDGELGAAEIARAFASVYLDGVAVG
jgi:TetR/AcrR family transcriptional regulator, cholesterol catabolism regulator